MIDKNSKNKRVQAGRLLGLGESATNVAKYVGVSRQALSAWKNDKDLKASMMEAQLVFEKIKTFYVGEPQRG